MVYDVFISHAYEDKDSFVNELVDELMKQGILVWYDDKDTAWGSSLREEIDKGLRLSKFGIVVLSPSYIADGKYWTKQELNGLFQMESIESGRILPIWHQLTKKEVAKYSPMIADRKSMTTAILTPGEIAEEFAKILKIVSENEELSVLNEKIQNLYSSYYKLNYEDQPVFFDKEQEKKDKYKMLDLLNKLNARLEEINDGSFEVDDRETERVRNL